MPNYFKGLASIMAWVLWLAGLVTGFSYLVMGIITGDLYNVNAPPPMAYNIGFFVALAMGVGSVVVMLLRKKME